MPTTSQTGIVTAVIGNIAINVALNLQRHAKHRLVRLALHGVHAPGRADYLRYLATVLLVAGQLTNLVAYGLAPASIVSPLGVLAVISNCIIPPLMFDETPTIHNITGTTIALPGILLLIVSAPQDDIAFSWPLSQWAKLYLACLCVIISVCSLIRQNATRPKLLLRVDACITAAMGTFCVLSIKCIGLVLYSRDTDKGGLLLMLALVVVVSGLLQLMLILSVFERFPVWQAVPHLFAFFTVMSGLGSAILFREFRHCGLVSKLEFVGGCCLVVAGVWVSARPHEPSSNIKVQTRSALNGPKRMSRRKQKRWSKQKRAAKLELEREFVQLDPHAPRNKKSRKRSRSDSRANRSQPQPVPRRHRRQSYPEFSHAPRQYRNFSLEREIIVHTSPAARSASREALVSVDEHTFLLMPRRQRGGNFDSI